MNLAAGPPSHWRVTLTDGLVVDVWADSVEGLSGPEEIVVSIGPGRLLKALMDYFPKLGPAINHLSGADKLMASIADHREAARTDPARPGRSQPA